MAQRREKEETELKVLETIPIMGTNDPTHLSDPNDRRPVKRRREENRCSSTGCRKKVGLVGFWCRCGEVFCCEHRYSDRHNCGYDYKAAGREAIARENPVVRAAKLVKV